METMQPNYQQPYSPQLPLPNATAVLVLGIVSIVTCFCWGIIGLTCAIIALVLAKKDMALYNATPGAYTPGSYSNVKSGRVCAIIGLCLSALYVVYVLFLIITIGTAFLSNPQDIFRQYQ